MSYTFSHGSIIWCREKDIYLLNSRKAEIDGLLWKTIYLTDVLNRYAGVILIIVVSVSKNKGLNRLK
jgi:hypothetical protein